MRKAIVTFMTLIFCTTMFFQPAMAVSVGDRVYAIYGKGSSANVEPGYVRVAGDSNSRIEWDYCSYCDEWVSNSSLWRSQSAAQKRVEEMDADHTSLGEAVGAAAFFVTLYSLFEALSE